MKATFWISENRLFFDMTMFFSSNSQKQSEKKISDRFRDE